MIDATAIRWESLAAIAAALTLALWALRDPENTAPTLSAPGSLAARFRIAAQRGAGVTVDLESGDILGRAPGCTVVIDNPTVSKHHARVGFNRRAWIEDLGSTNGTYVNGRRIAGSTWLRRGDRIALGAAKLSFLGLVPRRASGSKG